MGEEVVEQLQRMLEKLNAGESDAMSFKYGAG